MKIIGIIPARYESTRFPGKPLVKIKGMPMIERVYKQALKSRYINRVLIATDDKRIVECAKGFYAKAEAGQIKEFTGIDSVYEIPLSPDLCIHTSTESIDVCVQKIFNLAKQKARL